MRRTADIRRPPRITPGGVITAIPDFALAGLFVLSYLGSDWAVVPSPDHLATIMLVEFFVIFSGFAWVGAMVRATSLWRKLLSFIGMSLVAALYLIPLSFGTDTWWPLTGFLLLMVRRMVTLLLNPNPDDEIQQANGRSLAVSTMSYLVILAACAIAMVVLELFLVEGNPLYVAGAPYFLALAISGMYDHAWIGRVTFSESSGA